MNFYPNEYINRTILHTFMPGRWSLSYWAVYQVWPALIYQQMTATTCWLCCQLPVRFFGQAKNKHLAAWERKCWINTFNICTLMANFAKKMYPSSPKYYSTRNQKKLCQKSVLPPFHNIYLNSSTILYGPFMCARHFDHPATVHTTSRFLVYCTLRTVHPSA